MEIMPNKTIISIALIKQKSTTWILKFWKDVKLWLLTILQKDLDHLEPLKQFGHHDREG